MSCIRFLPLLLSASIAHAQTPVGPTPPPDPNAPAPAEPAPPPPTMAPPQPMPSPVQPTRRWYGYQEIVAVGAASLLGVVATTSDLEGQRRGAAITVSVMFGILAGPLIHGLNGTRSPYKLRLSAQLVGGGALVGFLGMLLYEGSKSNDMDETTDINWDNIGIAAFGGMALGATIDGIFFGYTAPKAPPPGYAISLVPVRGGGTAGIAGTF